MNRLAGSLVAVIALCLFDCLSCAQEDKPHVLKQDTRFFDPGFAEPLGILKLQEVQKELKLSDTQINKTKELVQKQKAGFRDLQRAGFNKERYQRGLQLLEDIRKAAGGVLTPSQSKRLEELHLQQAGPAAFLLHRVADILQLSQTQKRDIKQIFNTGRKELLMKFFSKENLEKIGKSGKEGPEKADFNRQAMGKIMKILNADQRSRFQKIIGEPFKGELPVYFPQGLYQGTSLKTEHGAGVAGS